MLKFQDDYTTLISTFEDFILLVYVMVDDLYQQFAPVSVAQRRNACTAKMPDSGIITLSACSEVADIDSEKAWYSFVKRNYRHLFPDLCCRIRFNRTRRNPLQATELPRQKLLFVFPIPASRYYVADGFPLPVCKFGRACFCRSFRADGREGLRDFAENHLDLVALGDKGYTGEQHLEDIRQKGICLMSLKPSSYKTNWPRDVRQLLFRFRRRVETAFPQLSEQMRAERVPAKRFRGLCARLQNKILGHNLCMAFISIFREACGIGKIKQLVF